MSSSKTRKRSGRLGELLGIPFRHRKSRTPSPSPSSTPSPAIGNTSTNTPNITLLSNSTSIPSAGTDNGSALAGPPITPGPAQQSLNPQPTTLPAPMKNEAFQKAIQEYINNLSNDDKIAFQSDTDVIQKLAELEQGKSPISNSHSQKVLKVLQCMQQFLVPVAICSQHSPQISSLVVGGLNCILTLALGYIGFFEKLTDMMERIADHLTYLSVYATGFQNSEKVQKALVAAYCDLLDFYVKVRKLFSNKEGKPSYAQGFTYFLRVTWEPFEARFQSIEAKFIHHTNIVARSAGAEYQMYYYQKEAQDERRQEDERRRKVLEWLSPHDFDETHERYFNKRFQSTGQWLLDDPRFISWRDEAQSSLLWCYGAPGSGKTILASMVIDHLSTRHEPSANIGITFIYCNFAESRSALEYMKLAIKQLCRRIKSLPSELNDSYEQHYKNHSRPGSQELQNVFRSTVQQFESVFFILDALDECTLSQRTDLCKFLTGVVGLTTGTSNGITKLFVASRKEPDIERAFLHKSFPTIEVEAEKVDSDIKLYAKAQIEQRLDDGSLTLNNPALKDKILTVLTTKAGGMFLWVELQLETIYAQVSDYGIEQALENIPDDLDATYERILDMISNKPRVQRELARKVFLFIAYAREPISIDTLGLAVAVEHPTQRLDTLRSSISTEKTILNVCGNLVAVDKESSIRHVHFVHFSVHEFFTSRQSGSYLYLEHEVAHREIARMCMTFLLILYSQIQDYCTLVECSFRNYILDALPQHLLTGNLNLLPPNDEMVNLTLSFFGKAPPMLGPFQPRPHLSFVTFSPSVLALMFNIPGTHQYYNPQLLSENQLDQDVLNWVHGVGNRMFVLLSGNRLAMHYATGRLDSVAVAKRLHAHGYPIDYSYDEALGTFYNFPGFIRSLQVLYRDDLGLTPLYLAKSGSMARFLIDSGASVGPRFVGGKLRNLIEHFGEGGDMEAVQLLLDRGAQQHKGAQRTTLQNASYRSNLETQIYIAAYRGEVETMRLLLENGADVNAQGGTYGNALQAAVYNCKVEAIQLLLDNGAEVNAQSGKFGNPLQAAASIGNVEAIQLLLDSGAEINAQGGRFYNALQAAARFGNVEAIQLLLDSGAEINAQGGELGNALQAAAYCGKVEAIQLLLDNGAEINAQHGKYGNALQAAACTGEVNAIQLLLDSGAEINAQGGEFGNALQAAALSGKVNAIQLLLDSGAEVNAQGGDFGNALQAAALSGKVDAIQLLLGSGAEINAQGGKFSNALQAAAHSGNVEAVQLLLDNGADVNAQGGHYDSAFQAAVRRGHVEVIRLLLDSGAEINERGGGFGSALNAAAFGGKVEVVQLLLDNGAEVDAPCGGFGTVLQATLVPDDRLPSKVNHALRIVEALLDHGADITAYVPGSRYGDALTAAKALWKDAPDHLTRFMELLESRGWDESKLTSSAGGKAAGLDT